MTDEPNITAVDEDGNELEDAEVLINGKPAGEGDGLWEENEDGSITPAGDQPVSTERAGITEVDERPTKDELAAGLYNMNGQLILRTED